MEVVWGESRNQDGTDPGTLSPRQRLISAAMVLVKTLKSTSQGIIDSALLGLHLTVVPLWQRFGHS